jgi:hypothetical protein
LIFDADDPHLVPGTGRARTINTKTDTARLTTTPKVGVCREKEAECKSDTATVVAWSTLTLQLQAGPSSDVRGNSEDEVGEERGATEGAKDLTGKSPALRESWFLGSTKGVYRCSRRISDFRF